MERERRNFDTVLLLLSVPLALAPGFAEVVGIAVLIAKRKPQGTDCTGFEQVTIPTNLQYSWLARLAERMEVVVELAVVAVVAVSVAAAPELY